MRTYGNAALEDLIEILVQEEIRTNEQDAMEVLLRSGNEDPTEEDIQDYFRSLHALLSREELLELLHEDPENEIVDDNTFAAYDPILED